jgi:murein DD-endopeptidase MepM/ murein hydrolase activator NlpD
MTLRRPYPSARRGSVLAIAVCIAATGLTAARGWSGAAGGDRGAAEAHTHAQPHAEAAAEEAAAEKAAAEKAAAGVATEAEPDEVALSATPGAHDAAFIFPVAGRDAGSVISRFGEPRDGGRRRHLGIDIAAPIGTPVLAPVAGTVDRVASGGAGGRVVWLREAGAHRLYYFAHLDAIHVTRGQRVRAGEQLGTVGTTGNAAGTVPHLHFAVHEGRDILDPWTFAAGAALPASADAAVDDSAREVMRTRLAGAALRAAPGRGATIAVLRRHETVTILGTAHGSYHVRVRGREGYVADWLLEQGSR